MTMDLETLLKPIAEDNPGGEDLSYDPLLDQIREAKREDDDTLPMGVWERELKKADWETAAKLCCEGLAERGKDLQIALWLLESWTHLDGFSGLKRGLELITEMSTRYWDSLHPLPENGNMERRISLYNWLGERLVTQIKQIPVTRPENKSAPPYHFLNWEGALRSITQPKTKDQPKDSNSIAITKFNKSMALTPATFLNESITALGDSITLLERLQERLDAEELEETPSMHPMVEVLTLIREKLMKTAGERDSASTPAAESGVDEKGEGPASEVTPIANVRPYTGIHNREQAYRMLDEISEFLMKTEPHSPTPYLLKRIASWGDMTLFDLLQEVVPAADEQTHIRELFFLNKDVSK
jgi:type VI secretion system protein ImpA